MTTNVTIDAHAGWPVKVERLNSETDYVEFYAVVEPESKETFATWDGVYLRIEELKKEKDVNSD